MVGDKAKERIEKEGTHDVGMENDLLYYVCVIRNKKVYTVLKIVVKIWRT
jgi:hypothetical protein